MDDMSRAELLRQIGDLIPPRDDVLLQLEQEAEAGAIPIVGPQEGALLHLLVLLSRPRLIVELGTATGYSGIWLLRGSAEARLITFEVDGGRADRARRAFGEARLSDRVDVREANAVEGLDGIERESVGLLFNDILFGLRDEARVESCFERSLATLEQGGLLVADNIGGDEVADADSLPGRCARRWISLVRGEPSLASLALPIGGGVLVAWKGSPPPGER
jgi:caffeoyl-CoA O-methyltransferase